MNKPSSAFLDANVLIYFLDETAELHQTTVATLQKLVDNQVEFFTSHHVVEEVYPNNPAFRKSLAVSSNNVEVLSEQ